MLRAQRPYNKIARVRAVYKLKRSMRRVGARALHNEARAPIQIVYFFGARLHAGGELIWTLIQCDWRSSTVMCISERRLITPRCDRRRHRWWRRRYVIARARARFRFLR